MRRHLVVLAAALVGLLGIAAIASADEPDSESVIFFFGDCEEQFAVTAAGGFFDDCFGFAIFFGFWNAESMAEEIADEAWDEFYEDFVVKKLIAFDLTSRGRATIGNGSGNICEEGYVGGNGDEEPTFGIWIAFFTLQPCFYD